MAIDFTSVKHNFFITPVSFNVSSRVLKTSKVYFLDTGLVAYLCGWITPEQLQKGALAGQIFETYVVGEILKSYFNNGLEPPIFFFRNNKAEEVDILFYQNGILYPVEIKKTASPNAGDVSAFKLLEAAFPSVTIGSGGLICTYDKVLPLTDKAKIIPVNWI
jgi:predicted AAA+ superfamily ATPase